MISTHLSRAAVVAAAAVAFYVVNNSIWLALDASSPSYDKAEHARIALGYLELFQEPARLSISRFLKITQYYPPLFHISSVLLTAPLGFSLAAVAATNFLFAGIAAFSIYQIGRRLFDEWVGAGAVVLTFLYPIVFALSRALLIDFALLAMVACCVYVILDTGCGVTKQSWRLGVAAGCLLLTKWTGVVFVAPLALVWLFLTIRRETPAAGRVLAALGTAIGVCILVAGPWYYHALDEFLRSATDAFGVYPQSEGDPAGLADSIAWYWNATDAALMLKPLMLATGVGLAACAIWSRAGVASAVLLAWILPALVFFVRIPNKDGRYVVPLLPAIALLAAAGIRAIPWRAARLPLSAAILVAGLWQFYAVSFAWPAKIDHFYTHAPTRQDWKIDDILAAMSEARAGRPIRVGFLPNHPDFEGNIADLTARMRKLPVGIEGLGHSYESPGLWGRYDFVVTKTGLIAAPHTILSRARQHDEIHARAASGTWPKFTLWRTWPLPDGSEAQVFRVDIPQLPN